MVHRCPYEKKKVTSQGELVPKNIKFLYYQIYQISIRVANLTEVVLGMDNGVPVRKIINSIELSIQKS